MLESISIKDDFKIIWIIYRYFMYIYPYMDNIRIFYG